MRLKPETLAAHRRRVAQQLDELMDSASDKPPKQQESKCPCADCQRRAAGRVEN